MKVAINNTQINRCSCVAIKLYSEKLAADLPISEIDYNPVKVESMSAHLQCSKLCTVDT